MNRYLILLLLLLACKSDPTPRPKGYFRIDIPKSEYFSFECNHCGYQSKLSSNAIFVEENEENQKLIYPKINGEIYLSYKKVLKDSLLSLMNTAQKITYKHTIKSSGIKEKPFENKTRKVYGLLYQIAGEVASSVQFYATDSVNQLVYGALYFNSKPNVDSLNPLIQNVQTDIIRFLENLQWKN